MSAAAAEAHALLDERPAPAAKRELLRALVERRDDALAAEVGEALLRDRADFDPRRLGIEEGPFTRTIVRRYRLKVAPINA